MNSLNPLQSTGSAILLGSAVVAFSILFSSGVVTFSKNAAGQPEIKLNQPSRQSAAADQGVAPGVPTQPIVGGQVAGAKVEVSTGHLPVKGKEDAKVTIIEFADFQCPFCEKFFNSTGSQIIKDYVETGKAKFAFRHYAFLGQESTWAAEAAECANEQDKFWEYHDYLYNHQGQENSGAFAKDKLEGFAAAIGLNTDQFKTCLETEKYAQKVRDDMSDGQKAGVNGTPATFVNGQLISGAQPFSAFQTAIEAALK